MSETVFMPLKQRLSNQLAHTYTLRECLSVGWEVYAMGSSKPLGVLVWVPDRNTWTALCDALSKTTYAHMVVVMATSLWPSIDWAPWQATGAQRIPLDAHADTYIFDLVEQTLQQWNRAEEDLADEVPYRALFKYSPSSKCVFVIPTTCIVDFNESFEAMTGYKQAELHHKRFIDLLDLHERYRLGHWFQEIKAQPKAHIQTRLQCSQGIVKDITLHLAKVPWETEEVWLAHIEDISHWVQEDEEKKWAQTQFGLLVQDSAEFVLILDSSACFTYISPNIEKRYLIDTRSYLSENAFDYVHPDDVQMLRDAFGSLNETRRVHLKPFRYFGQNNQWRWFEGTLMDLRDQAPMYGYMVSVHDITKRIRIEKENNERSKRHEALVQSVHDLVYEHTLLDPVLHFGSTGYQKFFADNNDNNQVELAAWLSKIHPLDYEVVASFFQPHVQSGTYELDYRLCDAEGHYLWVADRFMIMKNADGTLLRIGAIQNIHQQRLQEVLTQLEKDIYQINTRMQLSLQEVLERITLRLEKILTQARCTVVELRQNRMYPLAGKRMPQAFSESITGIEIGPQVGSCGTAMYTRQPVWVDDVTQSPLWMPYLSAMGPFTFKSCWSVPIFKSNGEIQGSFACYTDQIQKPDPTEILIMERMANLVGIVMENRRTNEAIKIAKERYEMVSLATRDIIWDWHVQADVIHWSRGLEEQFGHVLERVNPCDSKWWFQHIHPEDSVHMSVQLYQFLSHKTSTWQHEYRFRCADGSYRYVLDKAYLVNDAEGQPYRLIGAMQDITAKKREELRLKLLETVILASKDGVLITEKIPERTDFQVTFCNEAFGRITGYSVEEVRQKDWLAWLQPHTTKHEWVKLNMALQHHHHCHFETQIPHAYQAMLWVQWDIIPLKNADAELTHWICILRDVTDMKMREVEKEHLIQELTQNNRDLKQFSYITSHNLRAPLSNLLGLMQLIEDIDIQDAELKELIDGFNVSTHLLNDTINDLVKVMVIKDNPNFAKEDVDLNELIGGLMVQTRYLSIDHEPTWDIQWQVPIVPNSNKSYLESVFLNLMTNAIKYRHPDRPLEVNLRSQRTAEGIEIKFQDNGIGIDLQRNKDKIFGLYQRFHHHADSKGLGLYLVKSQIESMGGRIGVESQVNQGTTFTIILNPN